MRKFTLPLVALFISSAAFSEDLVTPESAKRLCETSVAKLMTSKVDQAFEALKPNWPAPEEEIKNLAYQTDSQLKMVSSRYGKPLGYEFIKTQSIGQSFIKQIYLGKFEKHAIRFSCIFYKPKNMWLVNSVFWDDKIPQMFE